MMLSRSPLRYRCRPSPTIAEQCRPRGADARVLNQGGAVAGVDVIDREDQGTSIPGVGDTTDVRTLGELAALFRALRRRHARTLDEKALPYRELAARTGWSHAVIADYFTGKVLPPTDRFDVLVQLLGATSEEQGALATARDRVEEYRSALSSGNRGQSAQDAERPAADVSTALVPRQLPAAPPAFTGRVNELAALSAGWDARHDADVPMVITAVAGAGGMGKTWLALYWAYQHLNRFPDGHLFVDLHGFSPADEPLPPAAALRGFLAALGVSLDQIPPDLQAQTALYRSLLVGKRILILLDNAADADQVLPLLPGSASCAVMVTSRRRLTSLITRHGARHVHLGGLTHDDAHRTLSIRLGHERITAEPEAVSELLACCAGYPLALGIVAGRASAAPDTPLADLAAELRDATTRLAALDDTDPAASLPAVLSWSLRGLDTEQRTVLGLLGIAPGPTIGLPAAASLTGHPPTQTKRIMRALEEASLLNRDASDRYSMHDLIRASAATIATDHLDDTTREPALRRIVDFYTHTAYAADRVIYPQREPIELPRYAPGSRPRSMPDPTTAMVWFDTEYPNLLAAQQIATRYRWHHTVWHLAWTLATYQHSRGHRNDRLAVWRTALNAAKHISDAVPQIITHRQLGQAHSVADRHDEAIDHLHLALTLAEQHDHPAHQAHTHHILTWACSRRGDNHQALHHATQAIHLYRTLHQPAWEADALNAAGWCAAQVGDYDTARTHCQAALTLYRKHNDLTGVAGTLDNLGYIDHHTGHHRRAVDHYQHALNLVRQAGYLAPAPDILTALGHTHTALDQHDKALDAWREALHLYQEQGRDTEALQVQQHLDRGSSIR